MKKLIQKLIPLKKQSKKAQKEHAKRQRGEWDTVSPVTRVVKSGKLYSRKGKKPDVTDE